MGLGDLTDESIGLENGSLCLPAHELRDQVFEPVIEKVLQLIEGQLVQSPNLEAIFLVGGFGQSNYLFRRVEEVFANRVGMIGVPPRGELAVVRGAVYFGLNPQIVTERVSRRTYGVETRMLFQKDLDPPEYSVVGVDNKTYCRQRFSVYVQKGQSVKVDECVSKNFVISYPNDTDSGTSKLYITQTPMNNPILADLFAFDGDGPPPRLTTHPLVKKVGHFPIRMPTLEGVKPGDKVNMTIRMYFGLTEIKIECVIRDKLFVFTSAFDASDSYGSVQRPPITDYHGSQPMLPPPTAGLAAPNPYALADPSASQVSLHGGIPPASYGYSGSGPMMSTPPMAAAQQPAYGAGYPPASSVYGGHAAGSGYGQNDYYSQQYSQGYPPSQSYYSGYPPSNSQGYPPQHGSYYGQH